MARGFRLLIVDDHSAFRTGMRRFLRLEPRIALINEVTDGQEAIMVVEDTLPDIILMDANMPGMDGIEATRQIKARWPGIRIVVLTVSSLYQESAFEAGADYFLIKEDVVPQLPEILASIFDNLDQSVELGQALLPPSTVIQPSDAPAT